MNNPFELIEARLNNIETLLLDLKHNPNEHFDKPEPEKLLTIQQAAEFLNLKVPTVYSKVSKRELPYMKQGKRLYFSSVDLIGFLKAGKRKSNLEIQADAEAYLQSKNK